MTQVYWHDREPVGSPAYVRRLRDQAAVALMQVHATMSVPDARHIREANSARCEVEDVLAHFAARDADALVRALGYEPPADQGEREDPDLADALRTAADLLRQARQELRDYRQNVDCECPPEGHHCGLPRLDRLIERIDEEVAPTDETKETA